MLERAKWLAVDSRKPVPCRPWTEEGSSIECNMQTSWEPIQIKYCRAILCAGTGGAADLHAGEGSEYDTEPPAATAR